MDVLKLLNQVRSGEVEVAEAAGLLKKLPLAVINRHANLVATYVCSQHGATPQLPADLTVIR